MSDVSVMYESEDRLKRQLFGFWFDDNRRELVLDTYAEQERKTTRHQWRSIPGTTYNRIKAGWGAEDLAVEIPLTETVKEDAKRAFCDTITVQRHQWGTGPRKAGK